MPVRSCADILRTGVLCPRSCGASFSSIQHDRKVHVFQPVPDTRLFFASWFSSVSEAPGIFGTGHFCRLFPAVFLFLDDGQLRILYGGADNFPSGLADQHGSSADVRSQFSDPGRAVFARRRTACLFRPCAYSPGPSFRKVEACGAVSRICVPGRVCPLRSVQGL